MFRNLKSTFDIWKTLQLLLDLYRGSGLGLPEHVEIVTGHKALEVGLPFVGRGVLLLVLGHGLLLDLPLLLDPLQVFPVLRGRRGQGRLPREVEQRLPSCRLLLGVLSHGLAARRGRGVVILRTSLHGEVAIKFPGEVTLGVATDGRFQRTLPVLNVRELRSRPKDL